MEVKREIPRPVVSDFPTCKQCGYMHPVPPDGICKNAQGQSHITESKYSPLLKRLADELNCKNPYTDRLAEMLEKTVRAWRIQINQEAQKNFPKKG